MAQLEDFQQPAQVNQQDRQLAQQGFDAAFEAALAGLVRNTEWRSSVLDWKTDTSFGVNGSSTEASKPKDTSKVAT